MQNTVAPPQVRSGTNIRRAFTRARIVGMIGVVVALLLLYAVLSRVGFEQTSVLTVPSTTGGVGTRPFRIPLPSVITTILIQGTLLLGGLWLAFKQPVRMIVVYMSSVIGLAFFTILIWAVAGSSVNIIDMFARVIRLATPITLGALAGIVCERSGVTNIGIEGTMLFSACLGYIAAITTNSTVAGVFAGILTGCVVSAFHAVLSINLKIDQVISGTVINLLAVGVTGFLRSALIIPYEQVNPTEAQALPTLPIPGLAQIPVIGPVLFSHAPITYAMLILVFVANVLLFRTVWGLRTRAIGEQPKAADTVGIPVNAMRFRNVVASGVFSGLAGAWFSLESTFIFNDVMTGGRGFIALAAVIFGKWTPLGAFGGALLFSGANALEFKLQGLNFGLPSQFLQMLPYIVTLIVLTGVIGRARPPAAVGKPYEKG